MIKLKVQEYCHSCPYFDADVEKIERLYFNEGHTADVIMDTFVWCEHHKLCENIKRHLEKGD